GFDRGISAALAVVLVACPCALGLATPLAVWNALGVAARHHVLFRSGQALERLAGIRAVRFDKTGTLTTGNVRVVSCLAEVGLDTPAGKLLLGRAAGLTAASLHPFSHAVHEFSAARGTAEVLTEIQQLSGRGLSGRAPETAETVLLGSRT